MVPQCRVGRSLLEFEIPVNISLTKKEIMQGALVGVMRHTECIRKHTKLNQQDAKVGWQNDIEGALGEMAWAKAVNKYWSGASTFLENGSSVSDVDDIEVRTTPLDSGKLILRVNDSDTKRFVLVTGLDGRYVIRGFIFGSEGKQQRFISAPNRRTAAFFVPQAELYNINELFTENQAVQEQ